MNYPIEFRFYDDIPLHIYYSPIKTKKSKYRTSSNQNFIINYRYISIDGINNHFARFINTTRISF